jgi:hypothetical protein
MSLLRAAIGALIGSIIVTMEGMPLRIIIEFLPMSLRVQGIFFLVGILVGLISGSSIWGAVSGIAVIPTTMLIYGVYYDRPDVSLQIMTVGFTNILYLVIGGVIGGLIIKSISGDDDYILVKMRK